MECLASGVRRSNLTWFYTRPGGSSAKYPKDVAIHDIQPSLLMVNLDLVNEKKEAVLIANCRKNKIVKMAGLVITRSFQTWFSEAGAGKACLFPERIITYITSSLLELSNWNLVVDCLSRRLLKFVRLYVAPVWPRAIDDIVSVSIFANSGERV